MYILLKRADMLIEWCQWVGFFTESVRGVHFSIHGCRERLMDASRGVEGERRRGNHCHVARICEGLGHWVSQ